MLSNDISKRLMIRYKKSKDFYKTNEKLKKEGYIVYANTKEEKGAINNGVQTNEKIIMVGKDKWNCLLFISYYDTPNNEYKQAINYMQY